jgi:hypothetical protein
MSFYLSLKEVWSFRFNFFLIFDVETLTFILGIDFDDLHARFFFGDKGGME